jgi:hypothetical protein
MRKTKGGRNSKYVRGRRERKRGKYFADSGKIEAVLK